MVTYTSIEKTLNYSLIDAVLFKHNVQPGGVIPVLQEIQSEYGYIPSDAIYYIAQRMNSTVSDIYSIATFYSQFRLKPIGKNIIKVCHGTACHLNGAERVASALAQATGAKEGKTSSDGVFTVEPVACLGCCSMAPCVSINSEVYGNLSSEDINKVVSQYKRSENIVHVD
jgi:NADH-quinone oxidoreductase subunit E